MKLFSRVLTIIALLVLISGGVNFDLPKSSAQTALTIQTYGTFNSIGIRIGDESSGLPEEVTQSKMQYRKKGDAQWKEAMPPVITYASQRLEEWFRGYYSISPSNADWYWIQHDGTEVVRTDLAPMIKRLHGSIMYLDSGTTYEVKVILQRQDNSVYQEVTSDVATKKDEVIYGHGYTLKVRQGGGGEYYPTIKEAWNNVRPGYTIEVEPGNYKEIFTDNNTAYGTTKSGGEPGNPITLRGKIGPNGERAVLDTTGSSYWPMRFDTNVHDLIIEGFEFKGLHDQRNTFIWFRFPADRIVIQNNKFTVDNEPNCTYAMFINMNAGKDILIQNNIGRATSLVKDGAGGMAIATSGGQGVVIRNNDFRVGGSQDNIQIHGPRSDSDIYNNFLEGEPHGTALEVEGGININVRVWNNTVISHNSDHSITSTTPIFGGPLYIFRNKFIAGPTGSQQGIKVDYGLEAADGSAEMAGLANLGPVYFLHNDFVFFGSSFTSYDNLFRTTDLTHCNYILRNNLVYGRVIRPIVIDNTLINRSSKNWGMVDPDNNLFWNGSATTNPNGHHEGVDANSIFSDPKLVTPQASSYDGLDLHLTETSPAINKGVMIPNINYDMPNADDNFVDTGPDIGFYEYGERTGLALIKTADPQTAQKGDTVTYTITYQNGSTQINNAKIEDPRPDGTTYVQNSASDGGVYANGIVTWNLKTLPPRASGTVSFKVIVGQYAPPPPPPV